MGKDVYKPQILDLNMNKILNLRINVINQKIISQEDILINNRINLSMIDSSNFEKKLIENNINYELENQLLTIIEGNYKILENLVFPRNLKIKIQPNTNIILGKNVSILAQGDFDAEGSIDRKINIRSVNPLDQNLAFGSVIILGDRESTKVNLKYLQVSGGNEANINGINTTGQFAIYNVHQVTINKSIFQNSYSDDGINIKNSKVVIDDNFFVNNSSDQLDCDNCQGMFIKNLFGNAPDRTDSLKNIGGDGLDLSFSDVFVENNIFKNNSDKGLSVGENTKVEIKKNSFIKNEIGIAVKDGSVAKSLNNEFNDNQQNIDLYIKKLFYNQPKIINGKN